MENKIEIINNRNESKNKSESTLNNVKYHFSRNKFDNDTLTSNFKY